MMKFIDQSQYVILSERPTCAKRLRPISWPEAREASTPDHAGRGQWSQGSRPTVRGTVSDAHQQWGMSARIYLDRQKDPRCAHGDKS